MQNNKHTDVNPAEYFKCYSINLSILLIEFMVCHSIQCRHVDYESKIDSDRTGYECMYILNPGLIDKLECIPLYRYLKNRIS
jgi:hypothetical protein